MKESDEIEQLFQTTFDGFEITPDPSVKKNIDRAIASKKKHRKFLWVFFPLFIVLISLGAVLYSKQVSGKGQVTENRNFGSPDDFVSTDTLSSEYNTDKEKIHGIEGTDSVHRLNGETSIISEGDRMEINLPGTGRSRSGRSMGKGNNQALTSDESQLPVFLTDTEMDLTSIDQNNVLHPEFSDSSFVDSTGFVNAESDSAELIIPSKGNVPVPTADNKWYLTGFFGWEGERTKPFEHLDMGDLLNAGKEFTHIRISSLYGKIEINRKTGAGFDIIGGIGFRSSKVTQYGSLYVLDSTLYVSPDVSSGPLADSFIYFVENQAAQQVFRVNSVLIPVGFAYSLSIGRSFNLRLSGGTEFSYGWLQNIQLQPGFSNPQFRSFGWNIWLRPEIHYSFGRLRLIGFGTLNHALFQQLKWDVTTRRNPLFGGGIGMQIRL